jgi:hypothetical protein
MASNPESLIKLKLVSRRPGGFIHSAMRRKVWPKLLGVNPSAKPVEFYTQYIPDKSHYYNATTSAAEAGEETKAGDGPSEDDGSPAKHRDSSVLRVDMERSLWNIHQLRHCTDEERAIKRGMMSCLVSWLIGGWLVGG